jgi:hypothetical protein
MFEILAEMIQARPERNRWGESDEQLSGQYTLRFCSDICQLRSNWRATALRIKNVATRVRVTKTISNNDGAESNLRTCDPLMHTSFVSLNPIDLKHIQQ